jgi:hypothetical protein
MPPAFNLSQDQTLQFNLCKVFLSLDVCINFRRASTSVLLDNRARFLARHPQDQVPTLIGCIFLKNVGSGDRI